MTESIDQDTDGLHSMAPLLSTESQDQFATLLAELEQEIQAKGVIERTYVRDIATYIWWEILRFRRYKTAIINNSRLAALQGILEQLLCRPDYDPDSDFMYVHSRAVEDLARDWFKKKSAKTKVARLLRNFQMDEGAIDAEAFRQCSEDVERLDRILSGLEFRRDKALGCIANYRQIFSKQLRQAGDRLLGNDDVPRFVARSGQAT